MNNIKLSDSASKTSRNSSGKNAQRLYSGRRNQSADERSASTYAAPTSAALAPSQQFEVPPSRAPGIRFWEKDDWTYAVQQNKIAQRETNKIAASRFDAIKKHQYAVFHQLNADEMTPAKWGSACEKAKMYHRITMCKGFPELAQGSAFWKVHQLATEYYPNFASQYVEHSGDETSASGTKRLHQGGLSSSSSKRAKRATTTTLADAPFTFKTTTPITDTDPVNTATDNTVQSLPVPVTTLSSAGVSSPVNATSAPIEGAMPTSLLLAVTTPDSGPSDDDYDMATGTSALLRDTVNVLAPLRAPGTSSPSSSTPSVRPPSPDHNSSHVSLTSGDKTPSLELGPLPNPSSDLQTTATTSTSTTAAISVNAPAARAGATKRVNILAQVKIRPPSTADVNTEIVPRAAQASQVATAAGSKEDTTLKAGAVATVKSSQKKPARTVKTLQAHPTSVTLRNLCLIDFLKEHPSASKDEFETHLSSLDGAARKVLEGRSKEATKARKLSSRAGMASGIGGDEE
ncbi:hypothetical protein TRAPUB_11938 [Trametes pubescens]|uniref:Uncharacterized protein n=1 Tax=Trametes pubescens TaxID=154538 RepID=A0A1M2VVI2_TRAPU|nr:hypothetical protein TRAPUB_11938 [Trametes pubescens]